jgi:hypothetical protein
MVQDMRRLRFYAQTGISVSVLAFTMGMLASGGAKEVYLPILTGIVGYWLPQPSAKSISHVEPTNEREKMEAQIINA